MGRHIYVLGNSRSGTTMLARMLGRHSQIRDLRELHFIEQMVTGEEFTSGSVCDPVQATDLAARLISVIRDGYFKGGAKDRYRAEAEELISTLDNPSVAAIYAAACQSETARVGKSVPLDQTPRNVFYIEEILAAYPQARILVMVRDPRDVCLSQKGKWRRRFMGAGNIPLMEALRSWSNYHPSVTARIWKLAVMAGDRSTDPRVMQLRFEDVATDTETMVRKVFDHLEMPYEPDVLNVTRSGSSNRRDEPGASGVDASRIGVWQDRLSPVEIAICEQIAGGLIEQHGYTLSGQGSSLFSRVAWAVLLPFKMGVSLGLNLKRVRSLGAWARKRLGA